MPHLPGWLMNLIWATLGLIILLIIMAIFKADFSIGSHGIHFTQDLIHGSN